MEDDGDLDNLFDEYESNDHQSAENVTGNAVNDGGTPEKVPVPKRIVKHPRLKFNPERLCGKRGIPILVDHFKDVRFKGKGHEKEDLKKLLTTIELWAHRLFPSMKFEDCLRQIEHLGKKRPVKTCLQKIRLDFPILDADFVHNEDEEEPDHPNESELEPPAEDAFDRLFNDYQETAPPVLISTPSSSQAEGNVLGTSFSTSMSEEQKKRMEHNKMLAIERRKIRLSVVQNLADSSDAENTTNKKPDLNSAPSKEPVENNTDPDLFFNNLQQIFTNTKTSIGNEKTEENCQSMHLKDREELEMDELMESVDETNQNKTNHDAGLLVRNDNSSQSDDGEQLGLDELMDLVDESGQDETAPDTLLCFKDADSIQNNKDLPADDEQDKNEDILLSVKTTDSSKDEDEHFNLKETEANIIDFAEQTAESLSNQVQHVKMPVDDL